MSGSAADAAIVAITMILVFMVRFAKSIVEILKWEGGMRQNP
jgi:hypothetical protein